jgi:hypothetical protein
MNADQTNSSSLFLICVHPRLSAAGFFRPFSAGQTEFVAPEHKDDGVDLTLIRWMLSLTPRERLAVMQDQVDSLLTLRAKFESQVFWKY